jgi:cGMP-dependent protein kinase
METQKNNRSNLHEISKNIKLEEMLVLKKLGEGQFGNVFLVTDKNKENCYALKCISKEETVKTKLERHVIN